jgi:hypothetical protein
MEAMQAITTKFCGYRFRSRLEARWAVFFDALGLNWTYEPEGFNLDGDWYLPDFWIEDWQSWVEIKAENVKAASMRHPGDFAWILCNKLADLSGKRVLLIQGQPWIDPTDSNAGFVTFNAKYSMNAFLHTPRWFNHEMEERYPSYKLNGWIFGMTDAGGIYLCHDCWPARFDLKSFIGSNTEIVNGVDPCADPLIQAFTAARSARFEHGEQGCWAP